MDIQWQAFSETFKGTVSTTDGGTTWTFAETPDAPPAPTWPTVGPLATMTARDLLADGSIRAGAAGPARFVAAVITTYNGSRHHHLQLLHLDRADDPRDRQPGRQGDHR